MNESGFYEGIGHQKGLRGKHAHRNLIAIDSSAGGIEALRAVVLRLSTDLPAALLVVTALSNMRQ
jgi:chemotaxis response regulator CheB